MTVKKCITKTILASSDKAIDEFINEYLSKYKVEQIIKTLYETNNVYFSISIIYNEEITKCCNDKENLKNCAEDKEMLKKIIHLNQPLSINRVQVEYQIGFNRACNLLAKLVELGITSSKEEGRKMLVSVEEAVRIIEES